MFVRSCAGAARPRRTVPQARSGRRRERLPQARQSTLASIRIGLLPCTVKGYALPGGSNSFSLSGAERPPGRPSLRDGSLPSADRTSSRSKGVNFTAEQAGSGSLFEPREGLVFLAELRVEDREMHGRDVGVLPGLLQKREGLPVERRHGRGIPRRGEVPSEVLGGLVVAGEGKVLLLFRDRFRKIALARVAVRQVTVEACVLRIELDRLPVLLERLIVPAGPVVDRARAGCLDGERVDCCACFPLRRRLGPRDTRSRLRIEAPMTLMGNRERAFSSSALGTFRIHFHRLSECESLLQRVSIDAALRGGFSEHSSIG